MLKLLLVGLACLALAGCEFLGGGGGSGGDGVGVPFTNIAFDKVHQFREGECGGPAGTCPQLDGGTGGFSAADSRFGCNLPKADGGCRFEPIVASINPKLHTFMYNLRVTTASGDLYEGEPRNELVGPVESGDGAIPDKFYRSGMDRYYRLIVNFGEISPPPRYADAVDAGQGTDGFQVFLRFQDEGACYSHVPLSLGFIRTAGPNGGDTGDDYRLALSSQQAYGVPPPSGEEHPWIGEDGVPTGDQEILLHVFWSTRACTGPCDWSAPDGGLVELWMNGEHMVSKELVTLGTWPTSPGVDCQARGEQCCAEQAKYSTLGNTEMPVFMKLGLAMDRMDGVVSHMTFRRLMIGKSCKDVSGECPR